VLFSVANIAVLFYARNIVLYIGAVWNWIGILLLSMVGSLLIGMYAAYRLFTLRTFTPFEREMMEMRVDVADIKEAVKDVVARVESMGAPGCGGDEAPPTTGGAHRADAPGGKGPEQE
jgi:hypothetical protein